MTTRILWFQNCDLETNDLLFLNGGELTLSNEPEYRATFKRLLSFDCEPSISQKDNQVYVKKLSSGWLIKGHYETRDIKGRKTPFIYYENEKDIDLVINRFKSDSDSLGMEYIESFFDVLSNLSRKVKDKRKLSREKYDEFVDRQF